MALGKRQRKVMIMRRISIRQELCRSRYIKYDLKESQSIAQQNDSKAKYYRKKKEQYKKLMKGMFMQMT